MPTYNLLKYSKNYTKTAASLRNFDKTSNLFSFNSESFKSKTSVARKTPEDNDSLTKAKVVIPLKHLSNFWRTLNIRLIYEHFK